MYKPETSALCRWPVVEPILVYTYVYAHCPCNRYVYTFTCTYNTPKTSAACYGVAMFSRID